MTLHRHRTSLAFGQIALVVVLSSPGLAMAADAVPTHLDFSVYAAGLNILKLQSDVDIRPDRYRINLAYRTTGLLSAVISSQIDSFAQGRWNGVHPLPIRFGSWGQLSGTNRRTEIDYVGGQPEIRALEPASESDRDPVPASMQRDSMDTLSAMAMLLRQVATSGRCDGQAKMFDGRRLSEITVRTAGTETLEAESRSSFAGPALRCEMTGRQLAGFKHDTDEAELRKPHFSTAWFAPVTPGGQMLPVRVIFETRFFGHAIAYVTQAAVRAPLP